MEACPEKGSGSTASGGLRAPKSASQSQIVGKPTTHATVATLKASGCRGREVVQVQSYIVASLLIKTFVLPIYCLDWSILQPAGKSKSKATDVQLSQNPINNSETRKSSFHPPKMFYKPGTPHNLPKDPFKACVIPRPIGWISSISAGEPQPPTYLLPSFLSFLLVCNSCPGSNQCLTAFLPC